MPLEVHTLVCICANLDVVFFKEVVVLASNFFIKQTHQRLIDNLIDLLLLLLCLVISVDLRSGLIFRLIYRRIYASRIFRNDLTLFILLCFLNNGVLLSPIVGNVAQLEVWETTMLVRDFGNCRVIFVFLLLAIRRRLLPIIKYSLFHFVYASKLKQVWINTSYR